LDLPVRLEQWASTVTQQPAAHTSEQRSRKEYVKNSTRFLVPTSFLLGENTRNAPKKGAKQNCRRRSIVGGEVEESHRSLSLVCTGALPCSVVSNTKDEGKGALLTKIAQQ